MIDQNQPFEFKEGVAPLKQLRESLQLSREEFGRRLGVTGSTIYRWETGIHEPTFTAAQMKNFYREVLSPLGLKITDLPDNLGPPSVA